MSTPANQVNIPPPGVDPTDWYQQQRRAMVAQMLTQQALSPEAVSNYGAARSRVSPLSIPMKMVEALMAKRAGVQAAQGQGQMMDQAERAFSGQPPASPDNSGPSPGAAPPTAAPPSQEQVTDPNSSGAPAGAAPGGGAQPPSAPVGPVATGVGPAPGQPMTPTPSTAPGGTGGASPLNPVGLPPALAFRMWMTDPNKYAELIAGTPEWRTALAANGGNQQAAAAALRQKLLKEGTLDLRPGGEVMIPDGRGGFTRMRNPNLPVGAEPIYGPNGEVQGATTIPGVAAAERTITGATQLGREENTPQEVPTGIPGQHRMQFGLQGIPGAPGAAPPPGAAPAGAGGAPGGAQPQLPSYFPPHTLAGGGGAPGGAAIPAGPTGGGQGPDWWPNMPRVPNQEHLGYTAGDYQEKLADLRAKKAGDYITQFGLEADTADQKLEYSAEMLRNLPKSFTGPQAQGATTFWNTINQVPGIKSLLPPNLAQDAAGTQVAIKNLVNQAIQGARALYGQRMTQSEVMLQKNEASPSITMGLQAIYALQRQEDAKSAYFIQRKQDFDQFMQQGGDPLRFEGAYQRKTPLASFSRDYAERNAAVYQPPKELMTPESIQLLRQRPELRDAAVQRFGYLPPDFRQ